MSAGRGAVGVRSAPYIEGWHSIAEANRIFGFDGWSRETVATNCVSEERRKGRHNCAYVSRVRIRVYAGDRDIVREGSGYGQGIGATPGEADSRPRRLS